MNLCFKLVLILIVFSFTKGVHGQLNYKAGFIITLANDTVYGKINDGGKIRNSKICLFKETKGKKTIKYLPGEIKAYRFKNDKYYCSEKVLFKGTYKSVFLEVLLDGCLNLYYDWHNKSMSYYIKKDDGLVIGLINMELDIKTHDYGHLAFNNYDDVKIAVYKDTLASVFRDSKKIKNQIFNIDYNSKSLLAITTEYINETCNANKCITYTKDLNKYKPRFGIYSGINFSEITFLTFKNFYSENFNISNAKSSVFKTYPIGLFLNFPLPLINDRLSFQFEFSTTSLDYRQSLYDAPNFTNNLTIQSRTFGIPVLLKYEIKRKIVSPSLAIGKSTNFVLNSMVNAEYLSDLSLHSYPKGGMFFEFGLDYKLSDKISLFSNLRVESFKNIVIVGKNLLTYRSILNTYNYQFDYKTNTTALNIGIKF